LRYRRRSLGAASADVVGFACALILSRFAFNVRFRSARSRW
jgi:hypothetical protein